MKPKCLVMLVTVALTVSAFAKEDIYSRRVQRLLPDKGDMRRVVDKGDVRRLPDFIVFLRHLIFGT